MRFDTLVTDWNAFPNSAEADGQVFVIPDVHGRSDLLGAMLDRIGGLPAPPPGTERNLVFTGDLIDRGPDSLGAIRLAVEASIGGKPAVILPGNHEGAMVDSLDMPLETGVFEDWFEWGGHSVLDQLPSGKAGTPEALLDELRAALPAGFVEHIRTASSHFRCGDLLMVHAGILPPIGARDPFTGMNRMTEAEFLAQPLADAPRLHWAKIREPFLRWTGGWDDARRQIIVHGHTIEHNDPVWTAADLAAATDHCESHCRINLDLGSCKHGRLAALEANGPKYRLHMVSEPPRYLP